MQNARKRERSVQFKIAADLRLLALCQGWEARLCRELSSREGDAWRRSQEPKTRPRRSPPPRALRTSSPRGRIRRWTAPPSQPPSLPQPTAAIVVSPRRVKITTSREKKTSNDDRERKTRDHHAIRVHSYELTKERTERQGRVTGQR